MLDEVRAAGSQKKGTSLAGCMTADLIVLLREIPTGRLGVCVFLREIPMGRSRVCMFLREIPMGRLGVSVRYPWEVESVRVPQRDTHG